MKLNKLGAAVTLFVSMNGVSAGTMGEVHDDLFFHGFYVGGNVGATSWDTVWVDRDAWVDNFDNDWALGSVNNRLHGVNGGVQGGFNWRQNNSVLGLEADWSWTNLSETDFHTPVATPGTVLELRNELNWFGSIRARAGIADCNLLLYATGGFAFADFKHNWAITAPVEGSEAFERNGTDWGGTAGFGAEYAMNSHFSFKAEALYFTFAEHNNFGFSAAGPETVSFTTINSFWVGRIGVNYTFC